MSSTAQPGSDVIGAVQLTLEQLGIRDASSLEDILGRLDRQLAEDVAQAKDAQAWESLRVRWLGRKQGVVGLISENWLRTAPPEFKRVIGQRLNALRQAAEQRIQEGASISAAAPSASPTIQSQPQSSPQWAQASALDITLPGDRRPIGVRHPLHCVIDEISKIFLSLGYSVEEGPEIESVYYNFEALNIPEDHPSRDDQDTFYIDPKTVLRTHTSPVQIRTMERQKPPVRIIVPGKVYRNETPDATHACMFYQVEGLAVDVNITFADLKGTMDHFLKAFFGPEVRTRLRPSFFPFTEPSAEVDMSCLFCRGTAGGCRVCKQSGWIELGGCGMVDPAVYSYVDYDASVYSGFAFGMGVDRLAMLKYGVKDIQLFYQGDVRFLHQFR